MPAPPPALAPAPLPAPVAPHPLAALAALGPAAEVLAELAADSDSDMLEELPPAGAGPPMAGAGPPPAQAERVDELAEQLGEIIESDVSGGEGFHADAIPEAAADSMEIDEPEESGFPFDVPTFTGGQAVEVERLTGNSPGIRIACAWHPPPCKKFRMLTIDVDMFGRKSAEYYLACWLDAKHMSAIDHNKWFPTRADVRAYLERKGIVPQR